MAGRALLAALLCALLATWGVMPADAAIGWLPATDLTADDEGSNSARVAVNADGLAVAVWSRDDGTRELVQASVRRAGRGWQAPVDLSSAVTGHLRPEIAVDPSGGAVAIWTSAGIVESAVRLPGGSWQAPTLLGYGDGSAQVAVDGEGNAVAVWQQRTGIGDSHLVQSAVRPAHGAWSEPVDLSTASAGDRLPAVAVDAAGNAFAVWQRAQRFENYQAFAAEGAMRPAGGVWQAPEDLSAAHQPGAAPQIAVNARGDAAAVWSRFDGNRLIAQGTVRPVGGTWQAPVDISTLTDASVSHPEVAVDEQGAALAIWGNYSTGVVQTADRPAGGGWQAPADLVGQETTEVTQVNVPQIALDPDGGAVAVWQHRAGSDIVAQAAARPAGEAWQQPVDLAGAHSGGVDVAADARGEAVVVWTFSPAGRNAVVQATGYHAPPTYDALGDSFSSGFGNAPYLTGTHHDAGPNDCQRSTRAYAQLVADAENLTLDFNACQRAETRHFYAPREPAWGEPPQLDQLSRRTALVTFTIGGNDAHFADVVLYCVLVGIDYVNDCYNDDDVEIPVAAALERLAGRSASPADVTPYDTLFKDVRARAPHATRVVVGYPKFFPAGGATGNCAFIKPVDQRWINEQTDKIDEIIRTAARRNGFVYADPGPRFVGHEFCSGGEEWFGRPAYANKFHPTVAGESAMGQAVVEALRTAPGTVHAVHPGEAVGGAFPVPSGQRRLSVVAQWPGSDVPLALISPSGVRHTRDAPGAGVAHDAGPTWEQYEIDDPEAGEWHFELFGADVAPGGEPVTLLHSTEPPVNAAPTATISYADNGDGTLTFSSARSTDADGLISRREWYVFGADTDDHTEADSVTVTRASRATSVTLVVTDDRGATSFAEALVPAIAPGAAPTLPVAALTPVVTPNGTPLAAVTDRIAPKITTLGLRKRVRTRGRTIWKPTRRLRGDVRLRLTLSEAATVTVQVASARTPTKRKAKTVLAKAGVVTIDLRGLAKGLSAGRAMLSVAAKDTAGNTAARRLSAKR